jgi:hypothetical protein
MFIDDAVSFILLLFLVIFLITVGESVRCRPTQTRRTVLPLAHRGSSLDDFFSRTDHSTAQNTSDQTSWALRVRRGGGDSESVGASSWKWFSTKSENWVPGEDVDTYTQYSWLADSFPFLNNLEKESVKSLKQKGGDVLEVVSLLRCGYQCYRDYYDDDFPWEETMFSGDLCSPRRKKINVAPQVTGLDSVFRTVVFSAIWVASLQVVARVLDADALNEVGS